MANQPLAVQVPPVQRLPTELYRSIVRQLSSTGELYRVLCISKEFYTEVIRRLYCTIDFPPLYDSSHTEGPTRCRKLISLLRATPNLCHYVKGIRLLDGALRDLDNIAEFLRLFPNIKRLHLLRSFELEYTEASSMLFGGQNPLPAVVVHGSYPRISARHMDALFGLHPGRYLDELAWYVPTYPFELDPPPSLSRISVLQGLPPLINFLYPQCARTVTHMKIVWLFDNSGLEETVRQAMREDDSALLALALQCTGKAIREAIKVPLPRLLYLGWQYQTTFAFGDAAARFNEAPADHINAFIQHLRSVLQLVPSLRKLRISWVRERGTNEVECSYIAHIKTLFGAHGALHDIDFSIPEEWPRLSHLQLKRDAEQPVDIVADEEEWMWYR